ncbi:MAG: LysM peptidoglycan-binding domain-containing protein [Thermodesulfobacteriota bacterium]|nr:LysM peptidoglycan-binding domain-containing protein [Thermodesulfobacteriota bacterium]
MAGDEPCFYYTIKKGDTLWDLSQKFYNSKWVWPGLWSINEQLTNPHWIYPGNRIKIYLKETVKKKAVKKEKDLKKAIIIKPEIKPVFHYSGMNSLSFIKQKAVTPLGRILKSEKIQLMMTENDTIYIEALGEKKMLPGNRYMIFNTEEILYTRGINDNKKKVAGIKHKIKGIAEIVEDHGDYVTATITTNFSFSAADDMIMEYQKKDNQLKILNNMEKIDARLIGSDNNNALLSNNSIAFLNMGKNDKIQPGQIYTILKEHKAKSFSSKIHLKPLVSGKIIVLHTEKRNSTVMVLSSKTEISPDVLIH